MCSSATCLVIRFFYGIKIFSDGNFLFIHGGLSSDGQKLNDLYKINLKTFRSKKCQIENDGSLTRAMHKMVIFEKNIFLFGGLTENDSISDDLFKLTPVEGSNRFTKYRIDFETKPTPRIAFNFHIINLPIHKSCEFLTKFLLSPNHSN